MKYYSWNTQDISDDLTMRYKNLRTIYNGYPNNASGIKKMYELTDNQFRCVTQVAVWYYTDGRNYDYSARIMTDIAYNFAWTNSMMNAFKAIISYNYTKIPPSWYELDLYISTNIKAQHLLSTNMSSIDDKIIDVNIAKQWIGRVGDSITLNLFADGKKIARQALNENNNWQYTFTNLEKYKN